MTAAEKSCCALLSALRDSGERVNHRRRRARLFISPKGPFSVPRPSRVQGADARKIDEKKRGEEEEEEETGGETPVNDKGKSAAATSTSIPIAALHAPTIPAPTP